MEGGSQPAASCKTFPEDCSPQPSIEHLPPELLLRLLITVGEKDLISLLYLSSTCSTLRSVAMDPRFWKQLFAIHRLPLPSSPSSSVQQDNKINSQQKSLKDAFFAQLTNFSGVYFTNARVKDRRCNRGSVYYLVLLQDTSGPVNFSGYFSYTSAFHNDYGDEHQTNYYGTFKAWKPNTTKKKKKEKKKKNNNKNKNKNQNTNPNKSNQETNNLVVDEKKSSSVAASNAAGGASGDDLPPSLCQDPLYLLPFCLELNNLAATKAENDYGPEPDPYFQPFKNYAHLVPVPQTTTTTTTRAQGIPTMGQSNNSSSSRGRSVDRLNKVDVIIYSSPVIPDKAKDGKALGLFLPVDDEYAERETLWERVKTRHWSAAQVWGHLWRAGHWTKYL
jgi:hypothetical protein